MAEEGAEWGPMEEGEGVPDGIFGKPAVRAAAAAVVAVGVLLIVKAVEVRWQRSGERALDPASVKCECDSQTKSDAQSHEKRSQDPQSKSRGWESRDGEFGSSGRRSPDS